MKPRPRTLQRFRWHLADRGWLYGAFIIPLAVWGGILALGDRHHAGLAERGRAVEQWPLVEASILNARITEVDASSEHHFGTRLSVAARFTYQVEGTDVQANYAATWNRSDSRDWSRVLAPGATIRLRVSPEDRSLVSLWDHNRVP